MAAARHEMEGDGMSEFEEAIIFARWILVQAGQFGALDPDGDIAGLARQFLRLVGERDAEGKVTG